MTSPDYSRTIETQRGDETAKVVSIVYKNHRGETSERRILPLQLWFGATEWHTAPQWLLLAYDFDKRANRDFAVRDITRFDC